MECYGRFYGHAAFWVGKHLSHRQPALQDPILWKYFQHWFTLCWNSRPMIGRLWSTDFYQPMRIFKFLHWNFLHRIGSWTLINWLFLAGFEPPPPVLTANHSTIEGTTSCLYGAIEQNLPQLFMKVLFGLFGRSRGPRWQRPFLGSRDTT